MDGAWVLDFGATAEVVVMPFFATLDLTLAVPLPAHRADLDVDQRYGVGLDVSLGGGLQVAHGVLLSVAASARLEDDLVLAGRRVPGSRRSSTSLALALAWDLDYPWTLQAALHSGLPVANLGANQPLEVGGTLGARYGTF